LAGFSRERSAVADLVSLQATPGVASRLVSNWKRGLDRVPSEENANPSDLGTGRSRSTRSRKRVARAALVI